ncbi:NTE family protein RssA [bacterium BMS3Abin07]|nr:NTE family protein RssA [bacterium BMS3Abin07]GBE31705.1 NTE family protein RssA [bacterium BMS3Bbin05]HDO21861.1 hypothetical protein [Nitrospirota bacterium]HDZ88253.1 hypothetical protein [Nitrospirota bacterium]
MFRKHRIGLALGGGAARGLAHIGVLEVFRENSIPVDVIAGTSMGAIIGAMYAADPDLNKLKNRLYGYLDSDAFRRARFDFLREEDKEEGEGIFYKFSYILQKSIFYTLSITKKSLMSEDTLMENITYLLDDINIEDTAIPFAVTTVDLDTGEEYIIKAGPLRTAVAASCALPGIIPPVVFGERKLFDGGWINAVPVEQALGCGADIVVGVEVSSGISEFKDPVNALDMVFRADTITRNALAKEKMKSADFVIKPDLGHIHWADFTSIDKCIQKGRSETMRCINEIKNVIKWKRAKLFFRGVW